MKAAKKNKYHIALALGRKELSIWAARGGFVLASYPFGFKLVFC